MTNQNNAEFVLRQVCKVHTNKVNEVLEEIGLHKGQPMLLHVLYRKDGVPQSYLAKELAIKPATTSAMVKRMEKAGYVIRKRDSDDERVTNVYLTAAGRSLSTKIYGYQEQMTDMVLKGFSEKEKEALKDLLSRILDNLSD